MENLHTYFCGSVIIFFGVSWGCSVFQFVISSSIVSKVSQSLLCAVPFTTPFLLFACYLSSHIQISHSQWYCYFV